MRESRHGRCGARYPTRGTLLVRERNGGRYVGNYVRRDVVWRRLGSGFRDWRDVESLIAFYLEDTWAPMLSREHPFLTRLARGQRP